MNPIIISIVTVPTEEAQKFIANKTFEPDANLSKLDQPPKSITEIKGDTLREKRLKDWIFTQGIKLEQSVLVKRQAALETAGRKWWTAKLVGWAIGGIETALPSTMAGDDERLLLTSLFDSLTNTYSGYTLVAKGGKDFHLPFLTGRAIALDLGLPQQLASTYPFNCVHDVFGRSAQSTQRSGLDDYSFGIGFPIVAKESPQFLYDQFQLGSEQSLQQMQSQCRDEVLLITEIMKRYQKRYAMSKSVVAEPAIPF